MKLQLNPEFLLTKSIDEIYPLTSDSIDLIIKCIGATPLQYNQDDVFMERVTGIINAYQFKVCAKLNDSIVIIVDEKRLIKLPTLMDIERCIGNTHIILIASSFTSTCIKQFENSKTITPISIINFLTVQPKKKSKKRNEDIGPTKIISVRIPIAGYPELGYPGSLSGPQVREIVESKIPVQNGEPVETTKKVVIGAYKRLIKSFTKMLEHINDGKKIDNKLWDKIMEENDVFRYFDQFNDELDEVIKDA